MKSKAPRSASAKPAALLRKIMLQGGRYYQSGDLFFQRLWRARVRALGFRVIAIEKHDCHHLWDLRLCGTLAAQSYLLLSKPVPPKALAAEDLLENQLKAEVRQIAQELGPPVKNSEITVSRTGAYFRVTFLWPQGEPGLLLRREKKPDAFRFLIRPWLRHIRN
jgi:hypothetical protein